MRRNAFTVRQRSPCLVPCVLKPSGILWVDTDAPNRRGRTAMTSYKAGNVSDSIYVEQVVSLYHTLIPTSIMSAGYLAAASTMALETGDRVLAALAIIGCFSSAGRIAVLLEGSRDAHDTHLTFDRAKHLERNF